MLELWKPYMKLKDINNPVIFTEFEEKFSEEGTKREITMKISDQHPFVIFYDDNEKCYYYLKARSAFGKNRQPRNIIIGQEVEVLGSVSGLFQWDSFVDCTQIFKCDKLLLESLIDIDDEINKKTTYLDNIDIQNILDVLKENIFKNPPNLSIIEVKADSNNKTYAKSLYLSEQKINKVDDFVNQMGISLYLDDIKKLNALESNKNSLYPRNRQRYQNGINFCLMFLKKYYPESINDFKQKQNSILTKDYIC